MGTAGGVKAYDFGLFLFGRLCYFVIPTVLIEGATIQIVITVHRKVSNHASASETVVQSQQQ